MQRLEVGHTVAEPVCVRDSADNALGRPVARPRGERVLDGHRPELLLRPIRFRREDVPPRAERHLGKDVVMAERSPMLSSSPPRTSNRVRQLLLIERTQKIWVWFQQPVRSAGHRVVPDAQLAIDGVSEDELEDVNCFHRRTGGAHVPFEQFVRSYEIAATLGDKPLQPWIADESGTHRLERRHTG